MKLLICQMAAAVALADYSYYNYDYWYGDYERCEVSYYGYDSCYDYDYDYDSDYQSGQTAGVVAGTLSLVSLVIPVLIISVCVIGSIVAVCCAVHVSNKNTAEARDIKKNKRKMKDYIRKIDPNYMFASELKKRQPANPQAFIVM